jgi:hypothetical protein
MKHFILFFAMILLPAAAFAQSGTAGELTWSLTDGTLTISGTGAMPDYGDLGGPWCNYRKSIRFLTIEKGVTSIGANAFFGYTDFAGCDSLTTVAIPGSVTSIGERAFYKCSNLTFVAIPGSVTSIGKEAFAACENMTAAPIPHSVTSIGEAAFIGCNSLTEVTIPGSVKNIGKGAFSYCNNLTSVVISHGVTSIEESAFMDCHSLTSVVIPGSVNSIGKWAFSYCYNLRALTLGWTKPLPVPVDVYMFTSVPIADATLHVPAGTKALYEAADTWKDFGTIVEDAGTGLPAINTSR